MANEITSLFGQWRKAVFKAEAESAVLQMHLRIVLSLIEQNALDEKLNVYERASLSAAKTKLEEIRGNRKRETKKRLSAFGRQRESTYTGPGA